VIDEDATWLSALPRGQATEVAQSSNAQRGCFQVTTDCGGQGQNETKRALLTPDEVQNIREGELLVKMLQRSPARLYYADAEVKDRAPTDGESWVSLLGPLRPSGALAWKIHGDVDRNRLAAPNATTGVCEDARTTVTWA